MANDLNAFWEQQNSIAKERIEAANRRIALSNTIIKDVGMMKKNGASIREIACKLKLSEGTVQTLLK